MRTLAPLVLIAGLGAVLLPGAVPAEKATLYQQPALSATTIVFVYGGDLWSVPRGGGSAGRLTTGGGLETRPHFSPDGSSIAFTGEVGGNEDVYVLPATGGVPRRLTYHPGDDEVSGWSADGRAVLFRSERRSTAPYGRLFTVSLDGGLPSPLPLPHADDGDLSPDGRRIAYQPITQAQPDWKRQRGGQGGQIWIADLADSSVERVPRDRSNDVHPFWIGEDVYFLSDRDGASTLFVWSSLKKDLRRVLDNDGLDIRWAAAGPGAVVYEQFGTIGLLDLTSGEARKVSIDVTADFDGVRPHQEKVSGQIVSAALSPHGAHAVFEARGEILTLPAEKGDPHNLSGTPGTMERDPAWSPDGRWIAYFSDAGGEYALHVQALQDGTVRRIDLGTPPSFYYTPVWSPDSTKVAYSDRRRILWYVDVEKGTPPVRIDRNPVGFSEDVLLPRWSPDSAWITYARHLPNLMHTVFVYSLEDGNVHQVTDGVADALFPAFDPGGKYLYFTVSTDIGPTSSWGDQSSLGHMVTRNVYAVVLRDGKIDFENVNRRIIALPIPATDITGLVPGKEGVVFVAARPCPENDGPGQTIFRFDVEERHAEEYATGVSFFTVSADGEKALFQQGKRWTLAGTGAVPAVDEVRLAMDALEVHVDPRAEWRQMYRDVWRGQRDHFYDPGHHGLDLDAASKLYEPYLDAIVHREDLNYLFREMLNQLTVGHLLVRGGDLPEAETVAGGLLGCDYTVENGRYRLARIYDPDPWNPDLRSPLSEPDAEVREGEFLLAVNGRELDGTDNVHRLFENTVDQEIRIRVGPHADGTDARDVTVRPLADDAALRRYAWAEDNRRKVDELSGGRLAYVFMPNTGLRGFTSFNRYFFAQTDKEGVLIDERYNTGGPLADYVLEYLSRVQLAAFNFRYAEQDIAVPAGAVYGPKAMLINSMARSGGDAMPWLFRKMQIGPLIGTRTWGGLVGGLEGPPLMDGGIYRAPDAPVYGLDGEWEVENVGVAPDVAVELDPAAWRQGHDLQLERAVEYLLDALEKNPRPKIRRPEYPRYERNLGLDTSPTRNPPP